MARMIALGLSFALAVIAGMSVIAQQPAAPTDCVEAVDFETILNRPVKPEFVETPLADVMHFFADQFDINIVLDAKGLTDAAVDPAAPVTFSIRKPVSLRAALRLILDEFDLTFVPQHEVLLITSEEREDETLSTEVYYVGDLIGAPSGSRKWGPLMQLITSTIDPDSWPDCGGPGSIQIFPAGDALVFSQKAEVHREVRELLAKLRAELKEHKLTKKSEANEPVTRAYALGTASGEQTAEAFRKLLSPKSWKENGGEGEICVISRVYATASQRSTHNSDVLVVRQTGDMHQQIDELLAAGNLGQMGGGMGGY